MLRYIEDESDKETLQESQQIPPPPISQIQQVESDQYWLPAMQPNLGMNNVHGREEDLHNYLPGSPNGMVAQYGVVGGCGNANFSGNSQECGGMMGQNSNQNCLIDTYETSLKDYSNAFRSTPYSSPAHPGMDSDSGLGNEEEDKGINWGSVLSLSSQSELDPLNNNSFEAETWQSSQSLDGSSSVGDGMDMSGHSGYDDIGWKLSADDVLKAFPSDEGLFCGISQVDTC